MNISRTVSVACVLVVSATLAASAAETTSPRIPYPDPAELSPGVRAVVESTPLNVSRMMARASEPVFNGFGAFTG
jgi:hypothetical protein